MSVLLLRITRRPWKAFLSVDRSVGICCSFTRTIAWSALCVTKLTPDAEPCMDRASYSLTADTADHLAGHSLHHTTASTDGIKQMHGTMLCLVLCYSSAYLLDTMCSCSDVVQQVACQMVSCVCCQAVAVAAEPCMARASYSLTADTADHLAGHLLHHTTASTDGIKQMHGTMLCIMLCYSSAHLLDTVCSCSDVVQQVACQMVSCVCCQAVAGCVLTRYCIRCHSNNLGVCPDCTTKCQQRR